MDNGQIPDSRRVLYYVGIALIGIGIVVFIKFGFFNLISSAPTVETPSFSSFGPPSLSPVEKPFMERAQEAGGNSMKGAIAGMALVLIGGVLMSIGRAGLAGSGVILDPR